MSEFETNDVVIVSWDFSHGEDKGVLIVGRQTNGVVKVINAFQGKDARDIYEKLTTVKKEV
jgi:ATP-dependent DNA ligase